MGKRFIKKYIHRVLQKYKHIVELDASGVTLQAAVTSNPIMVGVDNPAIGAVTQCQARSRVKGFWFELTCACAAAVASGQSFQWCFQASPQSSVPVVDPTLQGVNTGKLYVFKSGIVTVQASSAPGKVMGFVKIPTKFQRLMNTDVVYFNIKTIYALGNVDQYHLKVIYKEIRG